MKNKDRKRKINFGIKKISIYQYLNYYFNPNGDVSLAMFYEEYFSFCTHEQFLEKLEVLKKEVEQLVYDNLREPLELHEKNHVKLMLKDYLPEIENLCTNIVPVAYFRSVKQCDVLNGKVIGVTDCNHETKYYAYHPSFLAEEQTLYEKEHPSKLSKRIDKEKIKY